ncbi:MAG: D-alanyl-D-alanine carboxypeptidase family protein [Neobacillus sp.]
MNKIMLGMAALCLVLGFSLTQFNQFADAETEVLETVPSPEPPAETETDPEPETKSGWVLEKNKWYFYKDHQLAKGWVEDGANWYYLDPQTGIMKTGWLEYNKNWYYLEKSGAMKTGWLEYNKKWYYLDKSGAMKTGWVEYNKKWYFLDHTGVMKTGWVLTSNKWYFLNKDGDMKTGWLYQNGKWYYLKPAGDMAIGWYQDSSKKYYYAYSNGEMAVNTRINGYYVGYTGQWIESTTTPYYLKGVLLVNKHHGLPSTYGGGEDPTARGAFEKMKTAAHNQGLTLTLTSGYRSYEYQKDLYWRYVSIYGQAEADRFSAYPGYSEHQTGLAFDIGGSNRSAWVNSGFDGTPEAKWLANNAHNYGFILRYPPGKEHITGYMYESWHFRYLGVEVATKVYKSGLTLEEYLGEY